jgi:hypothetical protein
VILYEDKILNVGLETFHSSILFLKRLHTTLCTNIGTKYSGKLITFLNSDALNRLGTLPLKRELPAKAQISLSSGSKYIPLNRDFCASV